MADCACNHFPASLGNVTFDPGVNMGIGTASPAAQCHVLGAGQATNTPSTSSGLGGALTLEDSGGLPNNGGLLLFGAGQGQFAGIKGLITDGGGNTTGDLMIATRNTTTDTTLTERLRITRLGNIGMGTTGPAAQLHVLGTGQATTAPSTASGLGGALILEDSGAAANNGGLLLFGAA
jgi:hypothetical protein